MKQLVTLALLLQIAPLCHADATLTYTSYSSGDDGTQMTYYIKDGMLRFIEQGSTRINLYDHSKQIFLSIDNQNGTISRIDKDILKHRTEQLNKQRLQRLEKAETQLDEQLKAMTPEEQEIAASLVNRLKYPEFYGAHTFLEVRPTEETKTINQFTCQVYKINLKERLLKKVCMVEADVIGLSEEDYRTLRDFYHFNYQARTRMMLAAGKTDFTLIDYEQEKMPGVPLEVVSYEDQTSTRPDIRLLLKEVSTKMLDSSLFEGQTGKK